MTARVYTRPARWTGHTGRVFSDRLYLVSYSQGISGFPKPDVPAVVTGRKARSMNPWVGRIVVSAATFRLEGGRLPDYQARCGISEVAAFLAANPYAAAVVVDDGTVRP